MCLELLEELFLNSYTFSKSLKQFLFITSNEIYIPGVKISVVKTPYPGVLSFTVDGNYFINAYIKINKIVIHFLKGQKYF